MAKQIVTGKKVTFFDSIDFNGKILEGAYHATYNKIENGELDEDTILGTDIGGAIFFSPPTNSEHAHITHGGKIYTLGSTIKTDVPEALKNVKINANIDVDGEITDEWQNGAILLNGLENEKLTTTITSKPWEKEIDVATTNINVKDLLKIINLLCKEVAILKHGSGPTSVTPKAPVAKTNLIFNGEAQELITQEQVTGVVMKYCAKSDSSVPVPSEYTTVIPKATNVGNYIVYWLAEPASASYVLSGTTSGSLSATISQELAVVPTITPKTDRKYGSSDKTEQIINIVDEGKHCKASYKIGEQPYKDVPTMVGLNAGTYTVKCLITADDGYYFDDGTTEKEINVNVTIAKGDSTVDFSISSSPLSVTINKGTSTDITFTVHNCVYNTAVSADEEVAKVERTDDNKISISGIDEGSTVVTVKFTGNTNYNDSEYTIAVLVNAPAVEYYFYTGYETVDETNIATKGTKIENYESIAPGTKIIGYSDPLWYKPAETRQPAGYYVIPSTCSIYDNSMGTESGYEITDSFYFADIKYNVYEIPSSKEIGNNTYLRKNN